MTGNIHYTIYVNSLHTCISIQGIFQLWFNTRTNIMTKLPHVTVIHQLRRHILHMTHSTGHKSACDLCDTSRKAQLWQSHFKFPIYIQSFLDFMFVASLFRIHYTDCKKSIKIYDSELNFSPFWPIMTIHMQTETPVLDMSHAL